MEKLRETMIDPVCGEEVEPRESHYRARYRDKTYFLCSLACQLAFQEDPEHYLEDDV